MRRGAVELNLSIISTEPVAVTLRCIKQRKQRHRRSSTAKIEDLIFKLKSQYTIVIVTHNMQQAARVAENTGFFLMGKLVEFAATTKIFTNPSDKRTEDYITGRFG